MANILERKEELKQILFANKNNFTTELFDYLNSLIELEFAVTKDYISIKERESLIENDLYYQIALYNIYHIIDRLLTNLNTTKFISFDEFSNNDSYEMQGLLKPPCSDEYILCRLIRILYNFNEYKNISIINDIYLSCDGNVSQKIKDEFLEKSAMSHKLHTLLLQELSLEKIPFESMSPVTNTKEINRNLRIIRKEQKLVRTMPGITFTHQLHQDYYLKNK